MPTHTVWSPFTTSWSSIIPNLSDIYLTMRNRHIFTAFAIAAMAFCFAQCGRTMTSEEAFPSLWIFNEKNTPLYADDWVQEPNIIGAMNGSPAYIKAVRADGKTGFSYKDINGNPFVGTLVKDDYLLFCVPSVNIEKGSSIEIEAALISCPAAPKYFIIEYHEGGRWKAAETMAVPEDPQLEYSFMNSGIPDGEPHEYTSVYQTITLGKAIKNDDLKIRFRAVGDFTCDGSPQSADAENGAIGFVHHGFNGAYIQNYGTAEMKDTTRIYCIGNSFTYFSNTASMLKEIAWSQGHYFDLKASLKGGQTLGQHVGRVLTNKLAEDGGYDIAIFQDQSQTPARYAADPEKNANIPEDYLALSEMVMKHSPGCRIIMEQTWAYPSQRFGGFGDFTTFTDLLEEGAQKMATQNGGDVSPIGNAYEIVFNENKEIRLYDTDNKHQSHYGAYLKACVNYLVITGEAFEGKVADCLVEPEKAAYLRNVAEKVVLGI